MKRKIGQIGIDTNILSGTGYVYIPTDVDRDKFISDCFNTCSISLLTTDGQRFDNVYVSRCVFFDLDFPKTISELGSLVFFIKHQKHNHPIIVGILNKRGEVIGIKNGQFKLGKKIDNNFVNIIGDANNGNLFITSKSNGSGVINVKCDNKIILNADNEVENISTICKNSVLNKFSIKIKNDIDDNETETIIEYERNKGFSYLDQFDNKILINESGFSYEDSNENKISITKDGILYKNDNGTFECDKNGKFSFENSNFSLTDLINKIYDLMAGIKTTTAIGIQPPMNLADMIASKQSDVPKILK